MLSKDKNELEPLRPVNDIAVIQPAYPETVEYADEYEYGPPGDDSGSRLSPSKIWQAIRKRKWLIVCIVVIVTGAVTIEVYRIKPTYQASTIVEIGKENTSLVKFGDVLIQNDDTIKTKTYMMQSTPLLEDLVIGMKLDRDPRFLSNLDPINVTYTKNSVPQALKSIIDRILLHNQPQTPALITPDTTAAAPTDRPTPSAADSERLEPFVGVIQKNLTVDVIPDTRLIQVSFTHTDPAIAAAIANGIVQNFIQRGFESKSERLAKTSNWLEATTRNLKEKVEQAEQSLALYTKEHDIFPTEGKQALAADKPTNLLAADKLTNLYGEVTRAETDRMLKESLYEEVKQGRIAQIPEAFTDPNTAELRRRLGEIATKMEKLEVNYGPENPQIIETQQEMTAIQKQIDASRGVLAAKFQADYERAVRDEGAFKAALEKAKAEAAQENQEAIQYAVLKEELDTTKSIYKTLLEKTNQTSFEVAQQSNNVQVIEPARPPKKSWAPDRFKAMLLAFALSLAAGIGLVVLLEHFDKTIKNVEDLRHQSQLPALAVIPAISGGTRHGLLGKRTHQDKADGEIGSNAAAPGGLIEVKPGHLTRLEDRSVAAEAYRLLRTSLVLSSGDTSSKTLLITSIQGGEGKTTTCINTAISLARLGKAVVIIDCDLRTSSVEKLFGIDKGPGVSTYLSAEVAISEMIRKTGIANLSLFPCGPTPPNPTELLSSQKMKQMLQILAERYDHIMIDSPPLTSLADSVILSTLVDAVILVVRGGKTNRDQLWLARNCLQSVGAKILGVVLNDADSGSAPYNAYYSQ